MIDPYTYNDTGLLIGPLRMERQRGPIGDVWVYCWNDPGVTDRVKAQVDAVVEFEKYANRHREN